MPVWVDYCAVNAERSLVSPKARSCHELQRRIRLRKTHWHFAAAEDFHFQVGARAAHPLNAGVLRILGDHAFRRFVDWQITDDHRFEATEVPPLTLKGKSEPVRAFEIGAVRAAAAAGRRRSGA